MSNSRTKNSILNIVSSFGGTIAYDLGYFVLRAIFVRTLAKEYLGLEGLFSNILNILSLMELGIGPALIVSLYKPIAENNVNCIKSLMRLYKKAYMIVGICVFAVGTMLVPLLPVLIKDIPENIDNVVLIYFLYVFNTAVSYFCIYKQSLFIADQKNYLVTFWYNIARLIMLAAQAIMLICTRNYIVYLCVQILFTVGANIYISHRADLQYPYLRDKNVEKLDENNKNDVIKYAYASTILNIGSKLVNGTDQIIISSIIGLVIGGMYSNYALVMTAGLAVLSKLFNACTASVGNLNVTSSDSKLSEVFYRFTFLGFWLASFCTICMACLLQEFITVWVGADMLLDKYTAICVVITFYLYSLRIPVQVFNTATGNFYHHKYRAFAEGGINLVVSIVLAKKIGIAGVILGTLISCIAVPFWIEPKIFYDEIIKEKLSDYFKLIANNVIITLTVGATAFLVCNVISISGVLGLIIKGLICCVIVNVFFAIIFIKNKDFEYYLCLLKKVLKIENRKNNNNLI